MALMRWDPLRELDLLQSEWTDLFRRALSSPWEEEGHLRPAVEVSETDDEVVVKAEVPGLDKKDLKLTVDDGTLVIRGETREEKEDKRRNFYAREIRYGAIYREVPLPAEVLPEKATAKLRKGILEVRIPKAPEASGKEIQVEVE
ncbi:MAG: Hsp20/alpha crystallin family protein [candidate division KSB1 bacterium]|nr:Hsp20/alpha crystallin family protein [candidate division KSB1 bacterium]